MFGNEMQQKCFADAIARQDDGEPINRSDIFADISQRWEDLPDAGFKGKEHYNTLASQHNAADREMRSKAQQPDQPDIRARVGSHLWSQASHEWPIDPTRVVDVIKNEISVPELGGFTSYSAQLREDYRRSCIVTDAGTLADFVLLFVDLHRNSIT
jgi:hypothetical protein